MSEEQLNASLDAEGAKPLEEGAEDVELTLQQLEGVAGGKMKTAGGLGWPPTKLEIFTGRVGQR